MELIYRDMHGKAKIEVSDEMHTEVNKIWDSERKKLRKDYPHVTYTVDEARTEETAPGPEEEYITKELYQELHNAVEQLSPKQRETIRALYFNEEKASEFATRTRRTKATVSINEKKAIEALRKILL